MNVAFLEKESRAGAAASSGEKGSAGGAGETGVAGLAEFVPGAGFKRAAGKRAF